MKYVKMLGLLAVAAAALMAFVGTASASVTSSTGNTPTIHAVSEGYATLHNPVATISCQSTVTGTVTSGHAASGASGPISTLSFTGCTGGSVHTTNASGHVATPGSLSIAAAGTTGNGTLSSSGATIILTLAGIECGYSTANTTIGTVTAGKNQTPAKEHATLDISANIPRTHGSFFCGSSGNWTGSYQVTHPTNLEIH